MIQWLGTHASTTGDPVSMPCQKLRSYNPGDQKKKKKKAKSMRKTQLFLMRIEPWSSKSEALLCPIKVQK